MSIYVHFATFGMLPAPVAALGLLPAPLTHRGRQVNPRCRPAIACCEYDGLPAALARVRTIRAIEGGATARDALMKRARKNPMVSGLISAEPSFTRLFTHATWDQYTGRLPLARWLDITKTWRYSTILRAIGPICLLASAWAFLVASLPATLLPRTSPIPMSLMVTAIGLLLVFRTNNSYVYSIPVAQPPVRSGRSAPPPFRCPGS